MEELHTAVILAGGKGTRMMPETTFTPKPMVHLGGKPLLAHTIDALPKQIHHVIIVVGHLKDVVKAYFRDEYGGRSIAYVEQPIALGTADALRLCIDLLPYWFIFGFADDLQDPKAIAELCRQKTAAMLVHKTADPTSFGIVEADKHGNLVRMHEKTKQPPGDLASTGMFLLPKKIFDYKPSVVGDQTKWEFHHSGMIEGYVQAGNPVKLVESGKWFPISTLEDLDRAKGVYTEYK